MATTKSTKRPLRADAAQNQILIVEAARKLFGARGLDAPLEDIAREAGVGVGTLYRRFPDRESLILAVFEQKLDQTIEMAHAALTGADPWTEVCTLLMFMFGTIANDRGMREHFIGSRYPLEVADSVRVEMVKLLDQAISKAQSSGDLRTDVTVRDIPPMMLMIGVVADFGAAIHPQFWERYAALLLDGLRNRPALSALPQPSLTAMEMVSAMQAKHT